MLQAGRAARYQATNSTEMVQHSHVVATKAWEVWCLGVCMYELWSEALFWPNGIALADVLVKLCSNEALPLSLANCPAPVTHVRYPRSQVLFVPNMLLGHLAFYCYYAKLMLKMQPSDKT